MSHRKSLKPAVCGFLMVLIAAVSLVGCVGGIGSDGAFVSFTVGNTTTTITLGPAGIFVVHSNTLVRNTASVQPFERAPTDTPGSATARLLSSSVTILPPEDSTGKGHVDQAIPINGTAILRLLIAPGDALSPCDTGIEIGSWSFDVQLGVVTSEFEDLNVANAAIALLLGNAVQICLEMQADFEGIIQIDDIQFIFGPSDDGGGGTTCRSDSDCPSNEACVGGRCELRPSQPGVCASDGDCGSGEVCVGGGCITAPVCSTDADCSTGETCANGECVPATPECVVNADCSTGETCTAGECLPAPPECVFDTDCSTGETCTAGECVPATPECVVDADCSTGETCTAGECVPAAPECVVDTDCATGEACTNSECVPAPKPEFTLAQIGHVGSEQIIVGPRADAASGFIPETGYGVTHMVLSGDGQNIWFITYNEFATDPADVQRLYFIQADGTNLLRSAVPLDSVTDGFAIPVMSSLATGDDGLRAVLEARRNIPATESASIFYDVIQPGLAATPVYDTLGLPPMLPFGDRRRVQLSDDGNFVSWSDGVTIWRYPMNIRNSAADAEFTVSGFACGKLAGDEIGSFDRTTVDVRTLFGIRAVEGSDVCNTIILGSSQTDSSIQDMTQNDFVIESVHISDDGLLMAYCLFSGTGSQADPAPCFVQGVDGPAAGFALTPTSDTWDRFTDIVLADRADRYRVVVSPNVFSPNGISVFETVGQNDRRTTGTDIFGANSQAVGTVQLSNDGTVMAGLTTLSPSPKANIYVLHDGNVGLPGFPSIESVSYRYDAEADAFVFRIQVTSDNGVNLVKVYPMKNGVDPGEYLPAEQNPFLDIRFGFGGVTAPVEGTTDRYEITVPLFGLGSLIDDTYVLRVVAVDGTDARTVFADIPAPLVTP